MESKCSYCWDLADKFEKAGNLQRAAEAALLGHKFARLERKPRRQEHDHEGRMARGELRSLIENAKSLYETIGHDDELPGWVSAYITLASDYMHSVSQYLEEEE